MSSEVQNPETVLHVQAPAQSASVPQPAAPALARAAGWRRIYRNLLLRAVLVAGFLFGLLLLAAHLKFGSLAIARAYLQGERLIIEPQSLSFGEAPVNEERELHFRVANWTGKSVQLVGKKSTYRCMVTDSLPLDIADGQTRELTIQVRMPAKTGEMTQAVTFYGDSEIKPSFVVTISGNVVE